jgi:redox-sensitive bicupin YhaK (pirin superfamily)
MVVSRRGFLVQASALAGAAGCRTGSSSPAPAAISRVERSVTRMLPGMPTTDGAGVKLTRVIGQPSLRNLDPFIMLDRIYSDDPSGYVAGFPDHPHRGFETVSIMLEGKIRHRDSRGNAGVITGGGAQWMTAGRGIVHSEMPEQDKGLLAGFQLWVNLPAAEKMCPQFYQDLQPQQLAEASLSSGSVARIISGSLNGLAGPVRTRPTSPTLATVLLADDKPFEVELPSDHTAFVFVHEGAVSIGATTVSESALAVLSPGNRLRVQARDRRSVLVVAAGKPLHEPIVQSGPFVMNTEAEIRRAWSDYRAGILDKA